MAEQHPRVTATDDPEFAERLGLTEWDEDLGQYVEPREVERTDGPEELVGDGSGEPLPPVGDSGQAAGAEGLNENGPGGEDFVIASDDQNAPTLADDGTVADDDEADDEER